MSDQKKAYVYVGFVVLIWSTVASAFKLTLRYTQFLELLLFASLFSLIAYATCMTVQQKWKLLKTYTASEYAQSAVLGLLNPFLYYLVLFKAYSLLPAQEAQPLNQTWAIILPLLSLLVLRQRITVKSIVALFISFTGVVIVSTRGDILGFRFSNFPGALLAIGSAFLWALFWLYNVKDKRDPVTKLFLNFLFGVLYCVIFLIITGQARFPPARGILGALYVGVFEMGITFLLWLKALELSETTAKVSNVIYLVPFLSFFVIRITVGEEILLSTILGLCFIISGILFQHYKTQQKPRQKLL